jgi:hypothetical protein
LHRWTVRRRNRGAEFSGEADHAFLFVELLDERKRGRLCDVMKVSDDFLERAIQRHVGSVLFFGRGS